MQGESPVQFATRVSVIGAGSLGTEHARIYSELAVAGKVVFAGIYDVIAEAARKLALKYGVRALDSLPEALGSSDALSVVTPTSTHFELVKAALQHGKHVMVEKPMTDNAAQAGELVELAQRHHCILQVGHVERFNPIFHYLQTVAADPRFIYRIARDGEEESSLLKKFLQAKDSIIVSQFGGKRIVREPVPIAKEEPLKLELEDFIGCVHAQRTPLVSGESAKRALDLAFE